MEVSYVNDFREGDDTESDDELMEPKPKRKRGPNRVWRLFKEFESQEEAEQYVNSKHIWKKSSVKDTLEGTKVEYRCSAGKYRSCECPAGLYLLFHSTNMKVSLFETECEHENHNTDPSRGLSIELKAFVRGKFEEGIQKPNAILAAIKRNKLPEPAKSKLISFLKQLRREKYGPPTVSATEINNWCAERKGIPSDDDEPFVLDYLIFAESLNVDEQDIKIVISTRRLLRLLRKSPMVQIGATYKVIWQGYPVMILGTSDKNQVFHPFGLAICKGEAAQDFTFIFQAFHRFDLRWSPTILLADGSEAITAGFRNVFGDTIKRVMCFSHVLKNMDKHLKSFKKGGIGKQITQDIHDLQACAEEKAFTKATELFFSKWKGKYGQKVDECLQYFQEQWISQHSGWYEGAAPGYPSTNNGLEATNAIVKSEHTLRERLPVGPFLNNVMEIITKWSTCRDPLSVNCLHYAEVRKVSLPQWTTAHQWAVQNLKVLKVESQEYPHHSTFFVHSSIVNNGITPTDISTYNDKMGKWETFEEFQRLYYGTWRISINEHKLEESHCSCPYFSKHLVCKHVLGMQIRLRLVEVPQEAKSIPMGQKRKRGRPSKAKMALLVQ